MPIDTKALQGFCKAIGDNTKYGGFISEDTAKQGRARYHTLVHGSAIPNDNDIVAVSFGKVAIEELAKMYDVKYPGWCGYRCYFIKSLDDIPGVGLVEHDDIIIIPYDKDNKDMINIKQDGMTPTNLPVDHRGVGPKGGGDVFNTSRPCPNYCQ